MQIWLDTIDFDTISDAVKTGIISGVTTNPSILSKASNIQETLSRLLDIQPGPVAVQVTSQTPEDIIEEAQAIFEFSSRIIVKIPVNYSGLIAMNALKKDNIPLLGTAVLYPAQALLAANQELDYIAPYFGHMGEHADETLKTIVEMLKTTKTKVLAASLRKLDHIITCNLLGVEAITIKPDLYRQLVTNQQAVEKFSEQFSSDWQQRHGEITIKEALLSLHLRKFSS